MDEGHVKGATVGRGVVDKEGNIGVDERKEEDTKEDRGEEEHAEDLQGVRRACMLFGWAYPCDGPKRHGPVCEHEGEADGFDERFLCDVSTV